MRIGFTTFATPKEYRDIVEPGIRSHEEYCATHGLNLLNRVEDVYDNARHPAWSKISLLLKYIGTRQYDWLLWIDADTIIMNPSISLEDILIESGIQKKHEMLVTRDPRGTINTGVFFVRCSRWSENFLKNVFAHVPPRTPGWEEQAALIQLYGRDHRGAKDKIHIENRTWKFNSYPVEKITLQSRPIRNIGLYHKGDFLVHFAGIHGDVLKNAMREFKNIQHLYCERGEEKEFSNEYCRENWDTLYGKNNTLTYIPIFDTMA